MPLVSRHVSMNYLWTFYISEWVCWYFFWKWPGCCVPAVCVHRLRYSKVIFMDSAKGESFTHICPSFLPATVHLQMNVLFFLKTGSLLHSTSMDWTAFPSVLRTQRATRGGNLGSAVWVHSPKWNWQRKDGKNRLCFRKIADCSFSWMAEDAMMKYSLSAKLFPPLLFSSHPVLFILLWGC